ncbi:MAG: hypothetical protein GOVbin2917_71 [Prokaryotic dsDNA virus sp.]|jgi:hypothetical protein|nr:MAG: hypothetical protein GOVbin2917_71 [Prokaryotic dsDNA virus sp.]|tara:strand:+ start:55868 stop:56329 length:462 start_codon:yes stop_codon:yes gene_type:complete
MTVIATKNDAQVLSGVLMDDMAGLVLDFNFAHRQTLTEAAATDVKLGDVVVWDTDHWEKATNLATLDGTSPLGYGLGIVVGFESLGDTYTKNMTTGNVVVLYQGAANVKEVGLDFGTLDATETDAAKAQLGKQGIKLKATTERLETSFYSASA